jgi:hypothetical protein
MPTGYEETEHEETTKQGRQAPDAPPGLQVEKERVTRGESPDEEIVDRGEEPTGRRPQLPEPARRPPSGNVSSRSPRLQSEMERVLRGEPPTEREQLPDWPLPKPDEVEPADPVSFGGDLPGDALARDERSDPEGKDHRSSR